MCRCCPGVHVGKCSDRCFSVISFGVEVWRLSQKGSWKWLVFRKDERETDRQTDVRHHWVVAGVPATGENGLSCLKKQEVGGWIGEVKAMGNNRKLQVYSMCIVDSKTLQGLFILVLTGVSHSELAVPSTVISLSEPAPTPLLPTLTISSTTA